MSAQLAGFIGSGNQIFDGKANGMIICDCRLAGR